MEATVSGRWTAGARGWLQLLCAVVALMLGAAAHAQSASTTALTASPSPAAYGQAVTLTATVSGANPSGAVTFLDGATSLGSASLNAGVATLSVSTLAVGSHTLSASYAGDGTNAASTSDPTALVVNTASTTSTVSSSANPAGFGANVTFTATVAGQAPTGSVTFMDGGNSVGSAALSGTGNSRTASLVLNNLAVGSHSITVAYGGDANNAASTSAALNQTINTAAAMVAIAAKNARMCWAVLSRGKRSACRSDGRSKR